MQQFFIIFLGLIINLKYNKNEKKDDSLKERMLLIIRPARIY